MLGYYINEVEDNIIDDAAEDIEKAMVELIEDDYNDIDNIAGIDANYDLEYIEDEFNDSEYYEDDFDDLKNNDNEYVDYILKDN